MRRKNDKQYQEIQKHGEFQKNDDKKYQEIPDQKDRGFCKENRRNNEEKDQEFSKTERIPNRKSSFDYTRTTLKDLRSKYSKYVNNFALSPVFLQENEEKNKLPEENNEEFPLNYKEIANFFNFVINSEIKIEFFKKELSLRPDFNLIDLFMFFDKEKSGFCTLENFVETLKEFGLNYRTKDAVLFFKRFDKNNNEFLRFFQ